MPVRAVDDKSSDTLVVVSGEGFWTGSSTLPHLHQYATPDRDSTASSRVANHVWGLPLEASPDARIGSGNGLSLGVRTGVIFELVIVAEGLEIGFPVVAPVELR